MQLQRRSLSAEVSSGAFNVVVTTYEYIIREKSVLGRVHWRSVISASCSFVMNMKPDIDVQVHDY